MKLIETEITTKGLTTFICSVAFMYNIILNLVEL